MEMKQETRQQEIHGTELQQLKPEVKISKVATPEGEDVNSLLDGHESEILTQLISQQTTAFIFN